MTQLRRPACIVVAVLVVAHVARAASYPPPTEGVVPSSKETRGHGTHTVAAVWKQYLAALLKESQ